MVVADAVMEVGSDIVVIVVFVVMDVVVVVVDVVKSITNDSVDVVVVLVELNIEEVVEFSAGKLSVDLLPAITTGIVIINIDDTTASSTNANVYLFFSLLIWVR